VKEKLVAAKTKTEMPQPAKPMAPKPATSAASATPRANPISRLGAYAHPPKSKKGKKA
jgi:hypothetical protein